MKPITKCSVPSPILNAFLLNVQMLLGIARARRWVDSLVAGRVTDTHTIADREGYSERSVCANLNLAFLSPAIVRVALDGTLPAGRGITEFVNAQMLWERQR